MGVAFWPAMPRTNTAELRKGDKIVAAKPLRHVPEGTTGKVMIVNGLGSWLRSWVQFDNGVWMGSISNDTLVRVADWPEYQRRRAEEAARPKEAVPAAAAAPEAAATEAPAAASGEASKVPAHLLARSK